MKIEDIYFELEKLKDSEKAAFSKKLMPDTKYPVLGIPIPKLREIAKKIVKEGLANEFIEKQRYVYFEDVLLIGFVIDFANYDLQKTIVEIDRLIPYMDTWGHTDTILFPKVMKKNYEQTILHYLPFQKSQDYIQQRIFAYSLLQFLARKAETVPLAIEYLKNIPSVEYYSMMMVSWTLADALVANYPVVIEQLRKQTFAKWIHNKAIQKARESRRISDEQKKELNALKIK